MIDALLLVEDLSAGLVLERLASESRQVQILRSLSKLPSRYELARLVNSLAPDLVFLELTRVAEALPLLEVLRDQDPSVGIVGFSDSCQELNPQALQQAGVTTLLSPPITLRDFQEAVAASIRRTHESLLPNLTCFPPSKAGSGASSVAVNVAVSAAGTLSVPALLIEADLHSGVVGELLQIEPVISIRTVLAEAAALDQTRWRNVVVRVGSLDVLLTDRSRKEPIPSWVEYFHLLRFVRTRYELIAVDLPEIVNDATVELVRRAAHVYVVTTPEVANLKLAEQRLRELACRGVRDTQIEIVVNRWHRTDMAPDEISRLLDSPVGAVLRNDYPVVRRYQTRGQSIPETNQLGQAILAFARKLTGHRPPGGEKPRFLQQLLSRR